VGGTEHPDRKTLPRIMVFGSKPVQSSTNWDIIAWIDLQHSTFNSADDLLS